MSSTATANLSTGVFQLPPLPAAGLNLGLPPPVPREDEASSEAGSNFGKGKGNGKTGISREQPRTPKAKSAAAVIEEKDKTGLAWHPCQLSRPANVCTHLSIILCSFSACMRLFVFSALKAQKEINMAVALDVKLDMKDADFIKINDTVTILRTSSVLRLCCTFARARLQVFFKKD